MELNDSTQVGEVFSLPVPVYYQPGFITWLLQQLL
jgi:hypothetical protein